MYDTWLFAVMGISFLPYSPSATTTEEEKQKYFRVPPVNFLLCVKLLDGPQSFSVIYTSI